MIDTIVAIATAHGVGGISIVRLSGPNSLEIAKKLTKKEYIQPRYATLLKIYDEEDFLDESIIIYFENPKSFTGEDVIEFQCHGGSMVSSLILAACIKNGARLAQAGEFSKRAVINDRMDLAKAEAIASLIESKSEDGAKILAKQLRGDLGTFVNTLRDDLVETLAFVEVNIDYAEEDLDPNLVKIIDNKLNKNISLLKKSLDASESRAGLLNGFKISIIGKPNVGKSSILNSLLNYNRAIISDIAGTTRDTIEEEMKIGTHLVKIVDTAGIREADDKIEKIGIQRSKDAIEESEIVLALFDLSREWDSDDDTILKLINEYKNQKEILIVLNKNDLQKKLDITKLENFSTISISSNNLTLVIDKLRAYLDTQLFEDELILINKRQIDATKNAYNSLILAKDELENEELELFAFNINEAISNISSITRSFERDEILDSMFSNFCLGK